MANRYAWLLLIFLAAAFLRLADLDSVPPGLTHDEADHGLDAWGVVNGVRPIYFTVGFGREPLYDYATAGLMSFLGPSILAGRLTSVFFSLLLIAGTYAWTRRAFGARIALLSAAGLAVSFWAVMTSRQALRSISLPALFSLAVYFYWRALKMPLDDQLRLAAGLRSLRAFIQIPIASYLLAGILLGFTFYAYIPARITWIIFPLLLLYLLVFDRPTFARAWPGTIVMLFVAGLIGLPLFAFLANNPAAETRLVQLSEPLTAAGRGEFQPLLNNAVDGLRLLTIEGDSQWRYNIAGRPFLSPLIGILFYAGLLIAIWWTVSGMRRNDLAGRSAPAFFSLVWLVVGLSPALITGSALSTTRIIGLQPVLFVFPALALALVAESNALPKRVAALFALLLYVAVLAQTARAYFDIWANEPEVRVQYETALVSAARYLNDFGQGSTAISTTTPNRFHSPAAAFLAMDNPDVTLRWFNGQHSLIIPRDEAATVIFTGFAPLNPALDDYFAGDLKDELPLRPSDLDRPLTIYATDGRSLIDRWQTQISAEIKEPETASIPVQLGDAVEFLGYDLQTPVVSAGDTVRLLTVWRVQRSLNDAVLFAQLLGSDGLPIAQSDRLDAPGDFWVEGDGLVQVHELQLPDSVEAGEYPLLIGLYTRPDLRRVPVLVDGVAVEDHLRLAPLTIVQ